MNDKYAKEIAKELKLIRRELQKMNKQYEPLVLESDQTVDVFDVRKGKIVKDFGRGNDD